MNNYHFCTFISHLQVCNVKSIFFKARKMISLKKERKEEMDSVLHVTDLNIVT